MLSIHLRGVNLLKAELDIKTQLDGLEWKVHIFQFENVTINHLDIPQSHSCCPISSKMDSGGHTFLFHLNLLSEFAVCWGKKPKSLPFDRLWFPLARAEMVAIIQRAT